MAPSTPPSTRRRRPGVWVGRTVAKLFHDDNDDEPRLYRGTVVSYDARRRLFWVRYEDEDAEEVDWQELQAILVVSSSEDTTTSDDTTSTATTTNTEKDSGVAAAAAAAVVTPADDPDDEDDDEDDGEDKEMEDDEGSEYQQESDSYSPSSSSDDDEKEVNRSLFAEKGEEEKNDDDQEEEWLDSKPPAKKKKRGSTKKEPNNKNNKTKKAAPRPKKPPTTRPNNTKPRRNKAPPNHHHHHHWPVDFQRSVAHRGLPVGSRATGRGGLEVRTLDGIAAHPLLHPPTLAKAVTRLQQGHHQAAAHLCGMAALQVHQVRGFLQAAYRKLDIPAPPALLLQGGDSAEELSPAALARLQEATKGVDGNLPGRLMVVRTGTAVDEETGDPLVPLELADFVGTADEIHERIGQDDLVTYAMHVAGDPAFQNWTVLHQRLDAAGLLPNNESRQKLPPFVVTVDWDGGEDSLPTGSWGTYASNEMDPNIEYQWALIEGATREAPAVLLGVSPCLVVTTQAVDDDSENNGRGTVAKVPDVIPALSAEVEQLRLPASLLQKAVRRNFCSPVPLLEACSLLLRGCQLGQTQDKKNPPRGGVLELLSTTWRAMLEDASPFAAPKDGSMLGFEELLLLSLVAAAEPLWMLPMPLIRKTIATVIRTQHQPANFNNIEKTTDDVERNWNLVDDGGKLQNMLQIMRAAVGGKIVRRSSLEESGPIGENEALLVNHFLVGTVPPIPEERLQRLDTECRMAAFDPNVSPSSLLLIQALLPEPPASWKKHSLPSLAKQVKKLVTNVNARMPDHHNLTRLAAWGNNRVTMPIAVAPRDEGPLKDCTSAREIVSSTGVLSEKEHEVIDCFEAVQRWREKERDHAKQNVQRNPDSMETEGSFARAEVGAAPTEYDGRLAFLLAFAKSEEIEVHPTGGKPEVVNVLFCGDKDEPLLVQRIGKARKESEGAYTRPESGSSGAKSVPSLGYVQRSRSKSDRLIVEAAECALAERWKQGRTVALPLPPPGFQWNIPGAEPGREEETEKAVELTAILHSPGKWSFSICGVDVEAFAASRLISPCSLGIQNHSPIPLGRKHEDLLRVALYHESNSTPGSVLNTLVELHAVAADARNKGTNEGMVYDWLPLASTGYMGSTVWRDAILALKTREKEDVRIGMILPDGTCSRDMTEGCLLRIFFVLESLYPSALIRSGSLKWRVRSRGAGFFHMMECLEQLSRGALTEEKVAVASNTSTKVSQKEKSSVPIETSRRRSKRRAAGVCGKAVASLAASEADNNSIEPNTSSSDTAERYLDDEEYLPLPRVTTKLWPHQEASVTKVLEGIKQGRRGHADASAVGAGKTLTALAVIVRVAAYMEETQGKRNGVLVMLPTTALVKEWLLQIAEHTSGFHTVEQREDGQLFSLTYGKSSPPIDGNTIVISTLDRVAKHPFVRQAAWDFVIIDECLSVQNADAKRVPSAWRQIEISSLGCLMLSATFFRSKYSDLFYMIRMLRTVFPRSMEWLSATIHEHIVCQVPETDRSWQMTGKPVSLLPTDLADYRGIVEAFKRKQLNNGGKALDFRRLFVDLEAFLRSKYEGRETKTSYFSTSVMAEAFGEACRELLNAGYRPLVFADTSNEAEHLLGVFQSSGLRARRWAEVARDNIARASGISEEKSNVIVAVKSVEGQGINMQRHADAIVCRPTPGDHLEQMKGRIDRPGQTTKKLKLVVLMAEHTIEEAKFANIHLAGNFFREYIAPVATRYRERIDLEATLAAGGTKKLKRGTVTGVWRRSLDEAGRSGAFARIPSFFTQDEDETSEIDDNHRPSKRSRRNDGTGSAVCSSKNQSNCSPDNEQDVVFAPLNKVLRNKGDPEAIRQAKVTAKNGKASLAIRRWLFPPKKPTKRNGLAKESFERFSDRKPPAVLDCDTVNQAVEHLSKDSKLAALIARVGADALMADRQSSRRSNRPRRLTQEALCDCVLRSITFTMVSVDAGKAFLRRLAMKIGVCFENMEPTKRARLLNETLERMQEGSDDYDDLSSSELFQMLLEGQTGGLIFTPLFLGLVIEDCLVIKGEQTGYPHLCGISHPCGKNDDHSVFLQKAREHAAGGKPVSAGYSKPKGDFIVALVNDLNSGKVTAEKLDQASDREAAKMLRGLKGIGDWCAGVILMHFLKRSDIMLYGDLTVRNCLNDIYDISHNTESETKVESVADFPDNAENRNLIDALCAKNSWEPYRSVVCLLCYHLQEENLVLL